MVSDDTVNEYLTTLIFYVDINCLTARVSSSCKFYGCMLLLSYMKINI